MATSTATSIRRMSAMLTRSQKGRTCLKEVCGPQKLRPRCKMMEMLSLISFVFFSADCAANPGATCEPISTFQSPQSVATWKPPTSGHARAVRLSHLAVSASGVSGREIFEWRRRWPAPDGAANKNNPGRRCASGGSARQLARPPASPFRDGFGGTFGVGLLNLAKSQTPSVGNRKESAGRYRQAPRALYPPQGMRPKLMIARTREDYGPVYCRNI